MHAATSGGLRAVPFQSELWAWGTSEPTPTEYCGRECVRLEQSTSTVAGVAFEDGVVEVELAVPRERGFHGVFWRGRDDENFESFFVRPHQVGNPDAVQYTPVFNGISSWQLYHGPGFWAPAVFPLDDWFRIRVAFAGGRAEVYVGDLDEPAPAIRELKAPVGPGRVGMFAGGPAIHVAGFAYDASGDVAFRAPGPAAVAASEGVVPAWAVSDACPEEALARGSALDRGLLAARTWTRLPSEPSASPISPA
jgi:hypothetical protein